MQTGRRQPDAPIQEWLDLRALQDYACVSERTLRSWIHRAEDPLPASRVGSKILVRRSVLDRWLEGHPLRPTEGVDVAGMVDEMVREITGTN